jgi:hypothetical protein
MRLEENTKKNYQGKIRRIVGFLEKDQELKETGSTINGELVIPIREDVMKAIFFWLATDPSLAKRGRVASAAGLGANATSDENDYDEDEATVETLDVVNASSTRTLEPTSLGADDEDILDRARTYPTISGSGIQGYKSAIVWKYGHRNQQLVPALDVWIEAFIRGYKRILSEKREAGVMKMHEGKSHMMFEGYLRIAKELRPLI